jgi:signal transduction histidine kinase
MEQTVRSSDIFELASRMRRITFEDLGLDKLIDRLPQRGKRGALLVTAGLLIAASLADWIAGHVSLGVLYMLPMMAGAVFLEPLELALLALGCAFLRSRFDYPGTTVELDLRFVFAAISYFTCGLFVAALIQTRRMTRRHLLRLQSEQALRKVAEDQLRLLVAGSPAAILTVDNSGFVIAANKAAESLFAIPSGERLVGRPIEEHLSVLSDALRHGNAVDGFRTSAQSMGHRANGEVFQADTWFSSYVGPEGLCLAAIVVDSSEEMRDREEQNLRRLLRAGRIATAAFAHECRNLSAAISMLCAHLGEKHGIAGDEDLTGIAGLAKGIEQMAALELSERRGDAGIVRDLSLRDVLNHLRIIIEPEWAEIHGEVYWEFPLTLPSVIADPHGLLQAFLNLAKNSHRAVQNEAHRWLSVCVTVDRQRALICFEDSGPGIAAWERLFQPFQQGADGTGLGLYLSRAFVRSYGGDLRYEPDADPPRFVVDLEIAH